MDGPSYRTEAYKAVDTADYRLSLIISLEDLSKVRSDYMNHLGKVSEDKELTRKFVCMLVVIMEHLLPKLEGGGEKWKTELAEFEEFKTWSDNILIPLNDTEELKKVHKLWRLILKAYDVLNISNV
jgi:hypothetical protein